MNEFFLRDASRVGVFYLPESRSTALEAAAQKSGLELLKADVEQFDESAAVLGELGRALHFPDWYGANFDALHDCLTDPEQEGATGRILRISGLDTLRAASPENFDTLIEVFRSAAEINREAGSILWIVLDTATSGIAPLPDA